METSLSTAPAKTAATVTASRISVFARPSHRFTVRPTPTPTPTLPQVSVTPVPSSQPSEEPDLASFSLDSSFFEPTMTLAIEDLFSVTPQAASSATPVEVKQEKKEAVAETARPARRPQSFRHREPKPRTEGTSDSRRRLDLNFFERRKKTAGVHRPAGGSTIIPITVEGTGKIARPTRVINEPLTSPVPMTVPSEVVVSATQGFASISVIGPFSTAISNELGQVSEHYDFLSVAPTLVAQEIYDVYEYEDDRQTTPLRSSDYTIDYDFPLGLVTTMDSTTVKGGYVTVEETSVIGTVIDGQYAQILESISHIYKTTPAEEAFSITPTRDIQTIKSVIQGAATQFIIPESTASLPVQALFPELSSRGRDSRGKVEAESLIQSRLRSALSKRRGTQNLGARHRSQVQQDPYIDEEEDHDLQRAGSHLRSSFSYQQTTAVKRTPEISTYYAQSVDATTYRPRVKPTASRRLNRPITLRPGASNPKRLGRPNNRRRPGSSSRPKLNVNRRPIKPIHDYEEDSFTEESYVKPSIEDPIVQGTQEQTLNIATSTPVDGPSDVWFELATIRSLHTFRVGTTKNTRYVTFTKTVTHTIETTAEPTLSQDELYETPLFENILHDSPRDISTLPPVSLGANEVSAVLTTVTETFSTTEVMEKMSVLPVLASGETRYHTLTQTYHITRVVTALKTMPPYEAFSFIPENSLNEFNGQLLAEGTENGESLLPGELEYDENGELVETTSEVRVPAPPGFKDRNLAELAGGQFNPDVFEEKLHPQLAAALRNRQQLPQQQPQQQAAVPQLIPGQLGAPVDPAVATPSLTPEQLQQLAYLRLLSPYGFGSPFSPLQQQPQTIVTSSQVTVTTDITTTSTRVFRVIFNARPILTTISSVEVVHTTLTSFSTTTITVAPTMPAFPFPFPPSPFQVG